MKKPLLYVLLALGVLALAGITYYQFGPQAKNRTVEVTASELVARPDLGFSFRFPSGEGALAFTQSTPEQLNNSELLQAFVMMEDSAQQTYLAEGGQSTPPSIAIFVFKRGEAPIGTNPDGSDLSAADKLRLWAESHNSFTSIVAAGEEVEEAKIDGAPALHYTLPGNPAQEMYVTRYQDKIYLFAGQYRSETDYLHTSYGDIVSSVRFD